MRNRGVIRGVDASIARRTAQLTRLLPPTSRSVLSLGAASLAGHAHTTQRFYHLLHLHQLLILSLSLSLLYFFFLERVRARERARENASGRMGGLRWPTSSKMWGVDLAAQRRSPDPFPLSRLERFRFVRTELKSRLNLRTLKVIEDDGWIESSLLFSCESFLE